MEKLVWGMAGLRFLSASIEFSAAMLMLYFGRVETAVKINASLAIVGPTVLLLVTALGLCGLAARLSPQGMLLVLAGVALIFLGIRTLSQ
ncbi:MAG: YqhV family protein [Thermoanaerobacterales bacterium]|nr:YqhV family protein [Thermoanaerobacterales bacterium]